MTGLKVFRKRRIKPSKETLERLEESQELLEEQQRLRDEAVDTKTSLEKALAQNHIAQLMLEALSAEKGDV